MTIAERIKQFRTNNGLTQAQLAQSLGVKQTTVTMWETGKRTPNIHMLNNIAVIFNTTVDNLINETQPDTHYTSTPAKKAKLLQLYEQLDSFGKKTVRMILYTELNRCKKQNTINDTKVDN